MEKLEEVLETILTIIAILIDFTFVILEAPYMLICSILLSYEKCTVVYMWYPINGVMSLRISNWTGKLEYNIEGHILIRKLFKK